jgi:imidazolonepropionase-like amidohydrolase
VVPGLIDSHAHVLGNQKDQSSAAGWQMSSAQKALWGVHNIQTWLDHGFTALRVQAKTIRDMHNWRYATALTEG